jgi:hypothetical protein
VIYKHSLIGIKILPMKVKLETYLQIRLSLEHKLISWTSLLLEHNLSRRFPPFMNPENILPSSQQPATLPILNQMNPAHNLTLNSFTNNFTSFTLPTLPTVRDHTLYFVCPDLPVTEGETSYGIRRIVHRITQFSLLVY